jgi:hypothetical protein
MQGVLADMTCLQEDVTVYYSVQLFTIIGSTMQQYLLDSTVTLRRGCVDDIGAARYIRLTQNVPDGYVVSLQKDLQKLGFYTFSEIDGVFGERTGQALRALQHVIWREPQVGDQLSIETEFFEIAETGLLDFATRQAIARMLARNGYPVQSDNVLQSVPFFSQGDPQWAGRILGRNATIAQKGCAVTCVAMVLKYYQRLVDPGLLDAYLDAQNGYAGDNLRWARAAGYPGAAGARLCYRRMHDGDFSERIDRQLQLGRPTIARVDYGRDADGRYNHFVVIIGGQDGRLVMHDPATAKGNGYRDSNGENIVQRTTRKGGYKLVGLDWLEPRG